MIVKFAYQTLDLLDIVGILKLGKGYCPKHTVALVHMAALKY